jgi:hypothetical protein
VVVEQLAILKKNPGFTRYPASSLLGVGAGCAHTPSKVPGLFACGENGAIDMIHEGTGVVPSPLVHLDTALVKHLQHISLEGSPPLPKWRTPAPATQSHLLEL